MSGREIDKRRRKRAGVCVSLISAAIALFTTGRVSAGFQLSAGDRLPSQKNKK